MTTTFEHAHAQLRAERAAVEDSLRELRRREHDLVAVALIDIAKRIEWWADRRGRLHPASSPESSSAADALRDMMRLAFDMGWHDQVLLYSEKVDGLEQVVLYVDFDDGEITLHLAGSTSALEALDNHRHRLPLKFDLRELLREVYAGEHERLVVKRNELSDRIDAVRRKLAELGVK